ncbi:MAG: YeeE/YedE family protein [Gammaproteobacteria bacterium]|nr:YeeE/YedE family protein [Gammaproteobacteria bacterium]
MIEPGSIPAALFGGALIGVAAVLMLALNGRILGVSGIAAGLIAPTSTDRLARALFLVGMLAGGVAIAVFLPSALPGAVSGNVLLLIPAGLAVGFGTRLGGGCTSGHGVCGMSRLSGRSITATMTFMFVAMVTVFIVRHLLEGN